MVPGVEGPSETEDIGARPSGTDDVGACRPRGVSGVRPARAPKEGGTGRGPAWPKALSTDGFIKVISSAAWRQWTCPSRRGITRRRGRLAKPVTTTIIVSTGSVHAEVIEPVTSEPRPGVAVGIVAVAPEPKVVVARGSWVLVEGPPETLARVA